MLGFSHLSSRICSPRGRQNSPAQAFLLSHLSAGNGTVEKTAHIFSTLVSSKIYRTPSFVLEKNGRQGLLFFLSSRELSPSTIPPFSFFNDYFPVHFIISSKRQWAEQARDYFPVGFLMSPIELADRWRKALSRSRCAAPSSFSRSKPGRNWGECVGTWDRGSMLITQYLRYLLACVLNKTGAIKKNTKIISSKVISKSINRNCIDVRRSQREDRRFVSISWNDILASDTIVEKNLGDSSHLKL